MKGSPILATAFACLIMLGMYLGMRVAFSNDEPQQHEPEISKPSSSGKVAVYAEIYFSHQPKSFSISHPESETIMLNVMNHDSPEWSGELMIPMEKLSSKEIEFLGKVEWLSPQEGHHFMQVIISPENLDPQERTLRAEGDIADIMKFDWKEDAK